MFVGTCELRAPTTSLRFSSHSDFSSFSISNLYTIYYMHSRFIFIYAYNLFEVLLMLLFFPVFNLEGKKWLVFSCWNFLSTHSTKCFFRSEQVFNDHIQMCFFEQCKNPWDWFIKRWIKRETTEKKNARKCLARTDLWETRGRKQQHHRIEINDFVLFPIVCGGVYWYSNLRCARYNENVGNELNEFLCHTPTMSSQEWFVC